MSTSKNKPKILVIVGPTASGKSDLAVDLALKFDGEVISADSRQVYRGLDIGTGKITKKEMRGVPHHLLDVASPTLRRGQGAFTASDFKRLSEKAIEEILSKGKVPIICGGTGFYIDALFGDKQIPEVPPNPKLRQRLEKKSVAELFEILKKLDPERASNIDPKNPRRLVRAIEICKALGQVPKFEIRNSKYETFKIGVAPLLKEITHPRKEQEYKIDETELKNRINKRIEKWFKQGLLKEVKDLHKKGLSWKRMSEIGLEYKLIANFLKLHHKPKVSKGTFDTTQLKKEMTEKTWQYAKRQMTWFKKERSIIWTEPKISLITPIVKNFLD